MKLLFSSPNEIYSNLYIHFADKDFSMSLNNRKYGTELQELLRLTIDILRGWLRVKKPGLSYILKEAGELPQDKGQRWPQINLERTKKGKALQRETGNTGRKYKMRTFL